MVCPSSAEWGCVCSIRFRCSEGAATKLCLCLDTVGGVTMRNSNHQAQSMSSAVFC